MFGPWKTVTIAKDGTTSAEVDLGDDYSKVTVLLPAIDSATLTIHVSNKSGGTFFPIHLPKVGTAGSAAHITTAATTSIAVTFAIGAAQFIKVVLGAAQATAARTIYVRGCN